MKKVILLAPTPPPVGGIAAWTVRMMNASLPNDWIVEVVDEKIIGEREFFGNKRKLNIRLEVKRCFSIWHSLWESLNDTNALVVHSCIAANTLPVLRECVCALITKIRRRKFIVHFRCTVPNQVKKKTNKLAVKLLSTIADTVIVLNSQSLKYMKTVTNTNIVVIPNFVDVEETTESHIIKDKVGTVLYVGGVTEKKGCIDLMEVAQSFPTIHFKLIGSAEDVCIEKAREIPNVELCGIKPHEMIKKELENADVFMFLSYFGGEGFSNALAEAMAAGVPCIVSDWAANKDMIEDKGGFVVPVHNISEAIDSLRKIEDPLIRRKQSIYNMSKVKEKYIDEVVQRNYVEIYDSLK